MNDGNKSIGVSRVIWGLMFIVIGSFMLADKVLNLHVFSAVKLWPIFVLAPGLIFEFSYFTTKRGPGMLVPGGILTVIGGLFFFETFTNWQHAAYTWPVYILAVAFGLFQLYLFTNGNSGLLIPIFILTLVAVTAFAAMMFHSLSVIFNSGTVIGIIFIFLGILVLFKGVFKGISKNN